jgi:tryptophan 7-halogenase
MSEASQNNGQSPPLRIVVVGGGTAGWMSAAALRRQLTSEEYSVTLIESDDIGTVGVGEATLPHIKIFNDMLGLNEAQFMRETRATFKLGIQFCDWQQAGSTYIHPFGAFGEPWGGVEFQHHWLRAQHSGAGSAPLQDFSYSVVAARNDKFEFPNEDPKSIRATYAYAYHFDAGLYAAFLRRWAIERGVRRIEGQVCEIARHESGNVSVLTLKSGERIAGDLFIDCSGFRSLLLGGIMNVNWQDWTAWLPCDRAYALPSRRSGKALTPYTRVSAKSAGWMWRIPLQHRTGNGYVFSSRFIAESAARDFLLTTIGSEAQGEPRLLKFSPGRRERAWAGNCIGIGLASGFLEPLESTSIYLVQAAVTDLINLIPRRGANIADRRLIDEFNRLNNMQYERIRDFLILHYTANERVGEPLWDYVRSMTLPDTLTHKLELFRSRAALPNYQYGLFARDSWLSVLMGQGVSPHSHDRLADSYALPALQERLSEFQQRIQDNVDAMPTHAEFVADYCQFSEAPLAQGAAV